MTIDPQTEAALALHRFGFGPRAEAIAKLASDPRGALLAELDRPGAGAIDDPSLLTSAEAAQAGRDFRQVRKAAPCLGADTGGVLSTWLGYSPQRIEELTRAGVLV